MRKYNGILVQKIENGFGYFISDGIFNFTINANTEYEAVCEMLDYFYEVYWYCGKEDIPVIEFKEMSMLEKEKALHDMKCVFDCMVYCNEERTEVIEIVI